MDSIPGIQSSILIRLHDTQNMMFIVHFCVSSALKEEWMTPFDIIYPLGVLFCALMDSIPEIQSSIRISLHYTQNVLFILHFGGSSAPKEGG